jgi:penicillin amidase
VRRVLRNGLLAVAALALLAASTIYVAVRGSVARDEGTRPLAGLSSAATVSRDALGVLTIEAADAVDASRALGYAAAQERFFEMDLMRRAAAGELAELFGAAALPLDRARRLHRFRARAQAVLSGLDGATRARLSAYVQGVNAGLADLALRPWPYLLLREAPVPWRDEDSLLVGDAMFFDLQGRAPARELALARLRRELPAPYAEFLLAAGSEWDAPIAGGPLPLPPLPPAGVIDLRRLDPKLFGREVDIATDPAVGSNSWAVAGSLTAHGAALVANDMHLNLRVPSVWLRARLRFGSGADAVDVSGVTLPGFPGIVVGSNGHVAWSFTNSYGDFFDWVEVKFSDGSKRRYRTADGERDVVRVEETIGVHGGPGETLVVRETVFGPIAHESAAFGTLAAAWTAHHPQALNLDLLRLESARDTAEALALAGRIGMPAQNFIVGDSKGTIGWTITGAVPRRVGFDPLLPADWSQPGVGWRGWIAPEDLPRVAAPASGRLWSANARMVDGEALAKLGDGGYPLGARAAQIRDDLLAHERFAEGDMLAIQLDDRALFLRRWWTLLREVLARHAGDARLAGIASATERWAGRAAIDSVDYRVVREFRDQVHRRVIDALAAPMRAIDPGYAMPRLPQAEGVVWELLRVRPPHLLAPTYADWDALLLASAQAVAAELGGKGDLDTRTWGERMRPAIRHPLSRAVPWLSPLLDMPRQPLPGDVDMPRVQGMEFGASMRMAVAPGREAAGILHMPGGQSGNPLSPYYGAGHDDWARGRATPFLPGPAQHRLVLVPGSAS